MNIKINPIISALAILLAIAVFTIVVFMFAKDVYAPTQVPPELPAGVEIPRPERPPESLLNGNNAPSNEPVFCTQEAKQCPDGSYVGRTAPNCEFAPCPSE